jgi:hypothetical protein
VLLVFVKQEVVGAALVVERDRRTEDAKEQPRLNKTTSRPKLVSQPLDSPILQNQNTGTRYWESKNSLAVILE